MFLIRRRLMESHGEFARTIDNAIQGRTLRITDLVDRITAHANENQTSHENISEFFFVSARVFKICTKSEVDRRSIQAAVRETVIMTRWDSLSNAKLARAMWSLASVGVKPDSILASHLISRENFTNKELCNVLWALSKWSSRTDTTSFGTAFEDLINKIDDNRTVGLSNDDLTALLRAIALVHSQ